MILDNEKQKVLLLELIKTTQFIGIIVDDLYKLKQAIIEAKIKEK